MNLELRQKLERVAGRIRSLRLWTGLAVCWLAWAAVGAAAFALARYGRISTPIGWVELISLATVSAFIYSVAVMCSVRDQRAVARRIEARHPELRTVLLTAVEQVSTPRKDLGYLQKAVVCEAVAHGRLHNWATTVGGWRMAAARLFQFLALGVLVGVCIGLANTAGASSGFASAIFGNRPVADSNLEVAVDPGNCEIERGSPLIVIAQFPRAVPTTASLVFTSSDTPTQSREMTRSLDDPKFVGQVGSVTSELTYHVDFAGQSSERYRVTVFDYPALVRADAKLEFPEYTSQKLKVVEDVRHISAVEGTKLTLECRLNKPVATATLVDAKDQKVALEADAKDNKLYRASWTLTESRRFKLQLVDAEKRANKLPEEIVVNVTPNNSPKVVLERPARDVEVSPLEELQLKWKAGDDYGVVRSGLSYALGGDEPKDIELPTEKPQKELSLAHLIELESLAAKPDQLVSYFVWAEDIGPDGKPRRAMSDMYFAEVRPFEQIYRQGEQPSAGEQQQQQQGQSGNQQKAEELVELQKQIINATWKLVRRESAGKLTAEFPKDSGLVKDSQQSAITRSAAMAQDLEDAESRAHLESAQSHMKQALNQLTSAALKPEIAPLRPALSEEQAAYQDLLKLRAREFQVVRGSQQQRGQSARGGSRSQRQLNQLELSADENRYETQSRARATEEGQVQQQSREVLNKLRDLARRQADLNDRLRELQSALEKAQTDAEREELKRELKRLRDQQQEILRDTDEMISQNEQSGNSQQAQNAREKMEESRSHVEQASRALEEGQLSQAVTEGTRAGRQLNDLRDQFRQQSANQFSEDMTEMRREARELDARQHQLSQQLREQDAAPSRALRPTGEQAEAQSGVKEQQQNLSNLLDRMKQTIDAAEEPEPLLARQLYDAAREANQKRLGETLDAARKLMDAGVRQEAGRAMKSADEGVSNLRKGVERAAESVLGDEAESLRRAQQKVDRLAQDLNRELDQSGNPQSDSQRASAFSPSPNANPFEGGSNPPATDSPPRDGNNNQRDSKSGSQQPGDRPGNSQRSEPTSEPPKPGDANPSGEPQQGGSQPQPANSEGRPGAGGAEQNGEQPSTGEDGPPNRERSTLRGGSNNRPNRGGVEELLERAAGREGGTRGGAGGPGGPITGREFRDWSERLRDVEEMLDDPELRSAAARIRDRAAEARAEFKKHAAEPDWAKLQVSLAQPLNELRKQISDELRRHESPDAQVPIDRDPVPAEYSEQVRRYYERLGSGE